MVIKIHQAQLLLKTVCRRLQQKVVRVVKFLILLFLFLKTLSAQEPTTPPPTTSANLEALQTTDSKKGISLIQDYLAPFFYDRERFRDPFESQGAAAPLRQGQVYGPFLELQKSRLSDYKLKGLLWNTSNPIAVFADKNGKEFRLGIKDYIGENFGYVASIREKEVVVIQTIEEDDKRYSTTKVIFLENQN